MELTEDEAAKIHTPSNLKLLEFLGDENGDMTPPKGRNREIIKQQRVVYTTDKSDDYGKEV